MLLETQEVEILAVWAIILEEAREEAISQEEMIKVGTNQIITNMAAETITTIDSKVVAEEATEIPEATEADRAIMESKLENNFRMKNTYNRGSHNFQR